MFRPAEPLRGPSLERRERGIGSLHCQRQSLFAEGDYVLNLQDYVTTTWGNDILTLDQSTARVKIRKASLLDDQAFSLRRRLYTTLEELRGRGLIVIDPDAAEGIDVAPWNARDV